MANTFRAWVLIFFESILLACSSPKNSPTSKAQLGHYLFFDTQLSVNNTKSCASCHNPAFAFTDGYIRSITALGENTLHNAPSLINVAQMNTFDWDNHHIGTLEQQMRRPLFGKNPVELGTEAQLPQLFNKLTQNPTYAPLVQQVYGDIKPKDTEKIIIEAISTYVKSLHSANSKFDKYQKGQVKLNISEESGMRLFFSKELACTSCHALPNFTIADKQGKEAYFNTGLYNLGDKHSYPHEDPGLIRNSGRPQDMGKFKVPSLRNVFATAPYMHDGSVATLGEVIDVYAQGGRHIKTGPYAGDGRKNKYKSPLIKGFQIDNEQKIDLLNFLQSLTDSSIFSNPTFQNPWPVK